MIDSTYQELMARGGPTFTRNVPKCAYAYYCAVIAYAKLLAVKQRNNYLTNSETEFLDLVRQRTPIALKPIVTYLSCIGEFKSPTGRTARTKILPVSYSRASGDTIRGYFGQVDEVTMVHYRSYPCLAVYMQYIQVCLAYTRDPNAYPNGLWNLPEGIRPASADAQRPNEALLGWAPATTLTNHHSTFLLDSRADQPAVDNPDIGYNLRLYTSVIGALAACTLETAPVGFNGEGSVAQIIVSRPQEFQRLGCKSPVKGSISYTVDGVVGYLGLAFRYRMCYPIAHPTSGIPYDWVHLPPDNWVENLNLPRDNEGPRDIEDFVVATMAPFERLSNWVRQMKGAQAHLNRYDDYDSS